MFLLFTTFLLIKGILCAPAYEDPKKPFQEVERTDIREIILITWPGNKIHRCYLEMFFCCKNISITSVIRIHSSQPKYDWRISGWIFLDKSREYKYRLTDCSQAGTSQAIGEFEIPQQRQNQTVFYFVCFPFHGNFSVERDLVLTGKSTETLRKKENENFQPTHENMKVIILYCIKDEYWLLLKNIL